MNNPSSNRRINPFSNWNTISASDYILKKKNLTKIKYIKDKRELNFKTNNYTVEQGKTVPFIQENLSIISNHFRTQCGKCHSKLVFMEKTPQKWMCDIEYSFNLECKSGGGKLGKKTQAYKCPNECDWIICAKCFNCKQKQKDIEKLIAEERKQLLKDEIEHDRRNAPNIKCIKGYGEYLDLAKGFFLTQPHCENTYPNTCNNFDNGKLVQNIWEAKYSVVDMTKTNRKHDLRGTIQPKQRTEEIFKFPFTIRKTIFCNKPVNNTASPDIHNVDDHHPHVHWFPANKNCDDFIPDYYPQWFPAKQDFVNYTHCHLGDKPHQGDKSHPSKVEKISLSITEKDN